MPLTDLDRQRLARAVALARKSLGYVEPNPPVGCVVARGDEVVGESWHKAYGGAHAEIEALNIAGERARGATVFVSLEPCSRAGKTPPCTDRLVAAGVSRVVYAARDPHPEQSGRADDVLRAAGIDVVGPADPEAGGALLTRFEQALGRSTPWVIAKWAMSLDGRIALATGKPGAISGTKSNLLAHIHRGRMDAIAVGATTLRTDDCQLTCRLEAGPPDGRPQPTRVVFATSLDVPLDARMIRSAREVPVIVLGTPDAPPERKAALEAAGCEVVLVDAGPGGVDPGAALRFLKGRGIHRLLVEGGGVLHGSLFGAGLVDQVSAYVAPMIIGTADPVAPVAGTRDPTMEAVVRLEEVHWRRVGDDLLMQGFVPRAEAE